MMAVELTGMTWSHSRGYSSIAAVSQRYEELHPEVTLRWENGLWRILKTSRLGSWPSGMTC